MEVTGGSVERSSLGWRWAIGVRARSRGELCRSDALPGVTVRTNRAGALDGTRSITNLACLGGEAGGVSALEIDPS